MFDRASPMDVLFEYEENLVVPISANCANGSPFTGNAKGANGAADWSGPFVDGRPHGAFMIEWGGIRGGHCMFENGRRVETKPLD